MTVSPWVSGPVSALAFAACVFLAAVAGRTLHFALLYHAVVFGLFFGIYNFLPGGFEKHFNIPSQTKTMTPSDIFYFTVIAHTGTGFGDVFPVTFPARVLVSLQVLFSFLHVANLLPMGGPPGGSNSST